MFFFLWNPPSVCREQRRKSVICHWEKNRQEFHKPHISVKAIKRKSKTNMTSEKCHFAVSSCERILFLCMWFDKHSICHGLVVKETWLMRRPAFPLRANCGQKKIRNTWKLLHSKHHSLKHPSAKIWPMPSSCLHFLLQNESPYLIKG